MFQVHEEVAEMGWSRRPALEGLRILFHPPLPCSLSCLRRLHFLVISNLYLLHIRGSICDRDNHRPRPTWRDGVFRHRFVLALLKPNKSTLSIRTLPPQLHDLEAVHSITPITPLSTPYLISLSWLSSCSFHRKAPLYNYYPGSA